MLYSKPNVANAYSCSSQSSSHPFPSQSSVIGTHGSRATGASTSTSAEHVFSGTLVGPNTSSQGLPANPGIAESFSSGGAQSSCSSAVGERPNSQTNAISIQGSCSVNSR
jgi:hypothetical protein